MSTNEKIEIKELSEEEIISLVKEILGNREKYQEEAKLILLLDDLEMRYPGCGYVYNYGYELKIIVGEADILVLKREENYDCTSREKIAVIPKTVPTALLLLEWDESPGAKNTLTIYVFSGEWRSLSLNLPYPLKYI